MVVQSIDPELNLQFSITRLAQIHVLGFPRSLGRDGGSRSRLSDTLIGRRRPDVVAETTRGSAHDRPAPSARGA